MTMFWSLNAQLPRIRSEKNLFNIELYMLGMAGGEIIQQTINKYEKIVGNYIDTEIVKPKYVDNVDTEAAIRRMKELGEKLGVSNKP